MFQWWHPTTWCNSKYNSTVIMNILWHAKFMSCQQARKIHVSSLWYCNTHTQHYCSTHATENVSYAIIQLQHACKQSRACFKRLAVQEKGMVLTVSVVHNCRRTIPLGSVGEIGYPLNCTGNHAPLVLTSNADEHLPFFPSELIVCSSRILEVLG